jgi:eukaryotic-like serine/threonine-protein kinase
MTPERYREIDRVFQEAVELAPADRAVFLDRACGGDAELRREVESLLEHDAPDTRLERSIRDVSASVVSEREPERLGPYRVTGVIGRGGMGVVYAAVRDDDSYRKQVAVKLVKRGMDTDFVPDSRASGGFWRGSSIRTSRNSWTADRRKTGGRTS